jgi:hypothetical protein
MLKIGDPFFKDYGFSVLIQGGGGVAGLPV